MMKHGFWMVFFIAVMSFSGFCVGIFEQNGDVGRVNILGSASFDYSTKEYQITGSGENIWAVTDAFQFAWKKMSGNAVLTADVRFKGEGKQPHRKACLMFRQNLDANSVYADAALHGDGLASLQFREPQGAATFEIPADVTAPLTLSLHKDGNLITLYVANEGQAFKAAGSKEIPLADPFYAGLAVCSHQADTQETAVFSNVCLSNQVTKNFDQRKLESRLEILTVANGERNIFYKAWDHFEAPNWSNDGQTLIFNSRGRLYKMPVKGGAPELINTDFAGQCNNDHGLSPDGKVLAISHNTQEQGSMIYLVPVTGGVPKPVTTKGPSYWHGWSPDGKTLVYCAERKGEFDVYSIPVGGGDEKRLTIAEGLDDGPEYSPDGNYIYFNSIRTGTMHIWRMKPDGSEQEQMTFDSCNDWFPHPSPDGKHIVFLSYPKEVQGHPADQPVMLRLMPVGERVPKVIARLYGGQGTINVPSWSPESDKIAFVSYRYIYP